jgi:phage terminase small subunit
MSDKLTIKQEKFAQGLFSGLSQREAYKQAYNAEKMKDNTIDRMAYDLVNNRKITARIQELTDELKERNMITVEKVLAELAIIGFSNTTDFIKVEEREYIVGYEKGEDGQDDKTKPVKQVGKGVNIYDMNQVDKSKLPALAGIKQGANGIEIKLHDKVKALELIGDHLGMFTKKLEMTGKDGGPIEVSALTPEERKTRIAELMVKMQDKK